MATTMSSKTNFKWRKIVTLLVVFLVFALILAVASTIPPLRSRARSLLSLAMAVVDGPNTRALSQGPLDNIIFLHHSTGEHFITQGGVRELLSNEGYQLWDHGYNYQGLTGPDGKSRHYSYRIPADNTDPDGLAVLFSQQEYSLPVNALSAVLQYEVIVFKSCFTPTSHVNSDEQLDFYKTQYLTIRQTIDRHPEKLFILLTQPPLNPAETNPDEAVRARMLSEWLLSPEFIGDRENLYVFDTFSFLSDNNPDSTTYSMLREDFRNGSDSHPNQTANKQIAPKLVEFIEQSIQDFSEAH